MEGLTTAVENGAYTVVLRDPETSHRTNLPVRSASGVGLVRVEADFLTGIEGPLYGINCWTQRDGSGFLGLIQVTNGVAEGSIAYEDADGDWEALQKAGEGPSARIGDVHTLRMDCGHLADGAVVVLSVNGKPLAAYEGDAARTGGGWSLDMHFAGTPIGGVAAITVQELRINPQD